MAKVKKSDKDLLIAIEDFLERSRIVGSEKDVESAKELKRSILKRYGLKEGPSRFGVFGNKIRGYVSPYELEVEEESEEENVKDETI